MFYKNYSAPSTNYADQNIYSAYSNTQWSAEKEKAAIKCTVCEKKCTELFLSIYRSGMNTENYCSVKCWGAVKKQ